MAIKEKEIETVLQKLGVNDGYMGFSYIIYGVSKTMNHPESIITIKKGLYQDIADSYQTTTYRVERNIRTVRDVIWERSDSTLLREIFYTDTKLSSGAMIDGLADYIIRNSKQ